MKKKLYIFITLFILISTVYCQTFEIRALNKGTDVIGVELRETSGTGTPTTGMFVTDIVFGLRWSDTYGVDLEAAITTNYVIQKSGVRQSLDGYHFQEFCASPTPYYFPENWTQNVWVEIASISNDASGSGFGDFEICPTDFSPGTDPNLGVDLTDYIPIINGSATEVSLPVELTSFTAEDGVDGVLLKWTTESETENLGFMLDRRIAETEDWNIVARYNTDDALLGQGSTPSATDYEYIDNLVEIGKEYEYRLSDVDYSGVVTYHATRFITVKNLVLNVIPEKFELFAAYPNPFNPHATIRYDIPKPTNVRITIYNQIGQKIRVLQNGIIQAGEHSVVWDSSNEQGQPVSAGVYLFNIDAGVFNKTQKMILLK